MSGDRVPDGLGRFAVGANQSLACRCNTSTTTGDSSAIRALSTSANRWW